MVSVTKILHFNKKKMAKNLWSVFWQFHDQRRRKLYHTLLGHGRQVETSIWMEQEAFKRDNWLRCCKVFLSYRTPKILSSLKIGSKIVGKTEREKKGEWSNHDWWLVVFFYCIGYIDYHIHVCFFSVRTETYSSVSICCCGFLQSFFFSSCDPVASCWAHLDTPYAT